MRQVLDTLVEGRSIDHKVTLPEGLTSQQIVERISANPDLKGDITEIPAEGTLLPDTYRFQIGDSRIDIIERMQVGTPKVPRQDVGGTRPGHRGEDAGRGGDPGVDRGEGDGPRR